MEKQESSLKEAELSNEQPIVVIKEELNLETVDHQNRLIVLLWMKMLRILLLIKLKKSSDFIGPRLPKLMTESERKAFFEELLA